MQRLSDEINAFHKSVRARALLIAIEWAGGIEALGKMIGFERSASRKWVACGRIPPLSALALSRIRGFPLTFQEMQPGFDMRTLIGVRCPRCRQRHGAAGRPTGIPLLLKACSEATARKRAAMPADVFERNRKRRSAASLSDVNSAQQDVTR